MKNKVSVFGGKGFVGSEFVRQNNKDMHVHNRTDYVPVSNKILNFISTVDNYNIHKDPYLDINTNLNLLVRLLENARGVFGEDVEFNFISSWFVYGKTECPAREDSCCNPTGFYSITKRAAEQLLISYCETFKMNYRILRLCNVLGKGDKKISRKKNAFQYMVQQVALNKNIDYLYRGDFYRDFMDVRDVARAIKLIITEGSLNEVYNVGSGNPANINEMVFFAKDMANSSSEISLMEVPEFHKIVQVKDMWMDNSKLLSLGFEYKYTIKDTIEDLVGYYRNHA